MLLQDVLEMKEHMDANCIPEENRKLALTWPQTYALVRDFQGHQYLDSSVYKECERCLNAISIGNYDVAAVAAPETIYGIRLTQIR